MHVTKMFVQDLWIKYKTIAISRFSVISRRIFDDLPPRNRRCFGYAWLCMWFTDDNQLEGNQEKLLWRHLQREVCRNMAHVTKTLAQLCTWLRRCSFKISLEICKQLITCCACFPPRNAWSTQRFFVWRQLSQQIPIQMFFIVVISTLYFCLPQNSKTRHMELSRFACRYHVRSR